jgi:hypothetical protein
VRARGQPQRVVVTVISALLLATGCSGATAPAEAVPALARTLAKIDRAIVDGRYERARTQVHALVRTTRRAHDAERLDDDDAERILASAAALLSDLPGANTRSQPTSQGATTGSDGQADTSGTRQPAHDHDEDAGDDDRDEDGKGDKKGGKDKENDEGEDKEDKGGDDGKKKGKGGD